MISTKKIVDEIIKKISRWFRVKIAKRFNENRRQNLCRSTQVFVARAPRNVHLARAPAHVHLLSVRGIKEAPVQTHELAPAAPPPRAPPRTSGPTGPNREFQQPPSSRLPKPGPSQRRLAEKKDYRHDSAVSTSADAAAVRLHAGSSYGSEAREDRHDEAVIMAP